MIGHGETYYVPEAVARLERFLRDHRNGKTREIDPKLFDLLYALRERAAVKAPFHLVSGYRSPETNEMLRSKSGGVARKSQHLLGKAIDVRLRGVDTADLRDAAIDLARGGVGFYRESDFIHLDTGGVRQW